MLTSKQRAYLRGKASVMDTIFQIGKGGISDNMIKQLYDALEARELVEAHDVEHVAEERFGVIVTSPER